MQKIYISKDAEDILAPREIMLYTLSAMLSGCSTDVFFDKNLKKDICCHTVEGKTAIETLVEQIKAKGYNVAHFSKDMAEYTCFYGPDASRNPLDYYSIVPRVLLDPQLTLYEKWVWMIIKNQLLLWDMGWLGIPYLTKQTIYEASGIKTFVFNRAWIGLKEKKRLHTLQFYDCCFNVNRYNYIINDEPTEEIHYSANINRDEIDEIVKRNVNYENIRRCAGETYCFENGRNIHKYEVYNKRDLDDAVRMIINTICCKSPTLTLDDQTISIMFAKERLLSLNGDDLDRALRDAKLRKKEFADKSEYRTYLLSSLIFGK